MSLEEPAFAHISDLHFTSLMTWPPEAPNAAWASRLIALKEDLAHQRPDALFVTGDIADNSSWELLEGSLEQAWTNARDFLEDLARTLFGDHETAACRDGFRFWREHHRMSLLVRSPLPRLQYCLTWEAPADEYEVLRAPGDPDTRLRDLVRGAVDGLLRRLRGLAVATAERANVHAFLQRCGQDALARFGLDDQVRVDLAILTEGSRLGVVAAVQGTGASWQPASLRPTCELGRTLRGKAFLQRDVRTYAPGIADSEKNPNRDPMEANTKHQVAIPLVYPPHLPYFPRVGTLTFSWESDRSAVSEALLDDEKLRHLVDDAHTQLAALARDLGIPFPQL